MTTYKEMPNKLANKEPFKGNTVMAVKHLKSDLYVVYSYSTPIFKIAKHGFIKYFNNKYYSSTTSKLQNMLIDVFNLNDGIEERGK